jgi:MFS transporter, DHA1 family, inner membrane transport protein
LTLTAGRFTSKVRAAFTILMIWAAGLGAAAQFGKISVLFDQLSQAYPEHAGVGIGFMVSIVGIVGLIFGTTAGLLVARIGPRRAIVAAMLLGAGVSLIESQFPPYAAMIVLRVLEGMSHLTVVVVGPTLIAGLAPLRHQGLAMTMWSSFFSVTYALLAILAPPLVAWGGPAALFVFHAGWMAVLAGVLRVLLPPDPPPPDVRIEGNLLTQHLTIYADPRMAAPATGFVFYTGLYVALLTLLPSLMPEGQRALVAAGMPLVSIAVSMICGVWLLRHVTAVHLVQIGFGAAAIAAIGLWLSLGNGHAMVTASFFLAGALGIVQGASFAAIPQLNATAADRAGASGAVAQLGNVGTTTGTPLLAFILVTVGQGGLAAFAFVLCLCGILIHTLQARRRRYR